MQEQINNIYTIDEKIGELPVIALRGIVGFPAVQMNIEIVRPISLKAFTAGATLYDAKVLLVAQKDISVDEPEHSDLYEIGVVAEIKHVVKNPQGNLSVVFEGLERAKLSSISSANGYFQGTYESLADIKGSNEDSKLDAMMHEIKSKLDKLSKIHPIFTDELRLSSEAITDPGYLCDFVASGALLDYKNKQTILDALNIDERLDKLLVLLSEELILLECEHDIQKQVREKIDRNQKDYFLREQIKAIQSELGEDEDDEIAEYEDKIMEANLPDDIREKLFKELSKLAKTPFGAAEGTVLRAYLDTCLEFPFGIKTNDEVKVDEARVILDEDHDGLEKVKERILEFVAVKEFAPDVKGQIICLVGPPGVGKTSVAASIARALKRKYARVSLGGMHDEAEIRGHRKTYVGAMPGRIMYAISQAGSQNPIILLDEVDKMGSDGGQPRCQFFQGFHQVHLVHRINQKMPILVVLASLSFRVHRKEK